MSISKDISSYIVRTGKIEDAEAILEIQKSVVSEGKFLIAYPEEFNRTSSQQKEWMQSILDNEKETLIVTEKDGEVVGWIVFEMNQNRKRLSHTGSFGMMIRKGYRELGIGGMLLKALLDWAEKDPRIEKVSLAVFSTNHRAISLYKKMGFIEEGRKIKEYKMSDNDYVDDILMYKLV
ncbi:Putative phosphinothricin acetyltransferase YwnH [Peribacillus sp. Bi96]|uniref:GNAT family N-acetyltransferase n=1 Tax=unclassified Peribacillus TaxID=2675266 RepID=UPI001D4861C6|nr:GNAT family N-acetyltransferase [Peribacillus sp. Bi96]CAH0314777.1 Putative phosphinothricin acetyltransferase YwnH [Peribacillus sp. Bi96]